MFTKEELANLEIRRKRFQERRLHREALLTRLALLQKIPSESQVFPDKFVTLIHGNLNERKEVAKVTEQLKKLRINDD